MKNFNLCFSTTLCVSFLFALNSCTTDSVFVSDDTLDKVGGKNQNSYHEPKKVDVVSAKSAVNDASGVLSPATLSEAYHIPDSITTFSTTDADDIIDPDWKKLITRLGNE